jgi:hypothetical protein
MSDVKLFGYDFKKTDINRQLILYQTKTKNLGPKEHFKTENIVPALLLTI